MLAPLSNASPAASSRVRPRSAESVWLFRYQSSVCPPEADKQSSGNVGSVGAWSHVELRWPNVWCTPMRGLPQDRASARAVIVPTRSEPSSPGPRVTAIRSISLGVHFASFRACSRTGSMHSSCFRAASSGITPASASKAALELEMTLLRTLQPSSTTATDVSSQEVSIPRIRIEFAATPFLSKNQKTRYKIHEYSFCFLYLVSCIFVA